MKTADGGGTCASSHEAVLRVLRGALALGRVVKRLSKLYGVPVSRVIQCYSSSRLPRLDELGRQIEPMLGGPNGKQTVLVFREQGSCGWGIYSDAGARRLGGE